MAGRWLAGEVDRVRNARHVRSRSERGGDGQG